MTYADLLPLTMTCSALTTRADISRPAPRPSPEASAALMVSSKAGHFVPQMYDSHRPQVPAQAARWPVISASADAANAPASSCRTWTQSI
jgi:hypothetical protein